TLMHYFTSRRPHTRSTRDWSSDVCSSDLGSKGGAILVDMTTSEPTLAREIYDAAKAKGVYSLDAPVSGGDVGAKNAALSIMIGRSEERRVGKWWRWRALECAVAYKWCDSS